MASFRISLWISVDGESDDSVAFNADCFLRYWCVKEKVRRIVMERMKKFRQRGFTLIELMVVMVILATLAFIVAPKFLGEPEKARRLKAEVTIANLETALKTYYLDNGFYPTTDQGLEALVREPNTDPIAERWREGGYLEKGRVPKDPWDNDFVYLSPGVQGDFDIISYGADKIEGGEGRNADVESGNLE
jgi:general secretion pathway protein G